MLVKTKSTDTASQKQMGDLGWITKREATGEFEKVFSLSEGEVSEPLQSKFGYHLMRVTKIVPERPLDFEDAKEAIRKQLTEKKQRDARALWVKKLREASSVQISNAGVRAFVKSNSAEALSAPPPSHEVPPSHEPVGKEKS
jgi:parvulin-like peptidyl-prolyl isomerase